MPHLRLAVVLAQSLLGKDELAQGRQVFHVLVGFIEGVDGELPVDCHRLSSLFITEHDPATESSTGRFALSVANGIGPDVGHRDWNSRFRRLVVPSELLRQIELRTAGEHAQDEQTPSAKKSTNYTFMVY